MLMICLSVAVIKTNLNTFNSVTLFQYILGCVGSKLHKLMQAQDDQVFHKQQLSVLQSTE